VKGVLLGLCLALAGSMIAAASAQPLIEAVKSGDQAAVRRLARSRAAVNTPEADGTTALHWAVRADDAAKVDSLLRAGANSNAADRYGITPLYLACVNGNAEIIRKLLDAGADLKAVDSAGETVLMTAARTGKPDALKLLIDRGANVNAVDPEFQETALMFAVRENHPEAVKVLIDRGASLNVATRVGPTQTFRLPCKGTGCGSEGVGINRGGIPDRGQRPATTGGMTPLLYAARDGRLAESKLLVAAGADVKLADPNGISPLLTAIFNDHLDVATFLLDHGADVNAYHPLGRTALMFAAISDFPSVDVVKVLVERGANVNARSQHKQAGDDGRTVLELAKWRGNTDIVALLTNAGGKSDPPKSLDLKPQRAASIEAAVQRSLPVLQRGDANFVSKSGCISCHNNSLEAMTVGLARQRGFKVDEKVASETVKGNVKYLGLKRDLLHQGFFFGAAQGDPALASYILIGLDAEHHKADLDTDAVAMFVKDRQMPDGRWAFGTDGRPPLCADGDIGSTVLSMRAIQLYTPSFDKPAYDRAVQLASAWLAKAESVTDDDRSWRLLGLAWARKNKDAIQRATRELLMVQRSDGGWSDLASKDSNAYSTGKALVALQAAGVAVSDPAYQRGVQYLMNTQLEDGSWHVATRAGGIQPYFENGFPHRYDQWISAAATSWATMALTYASRAPSE